MRENQLLPYHGVLFLQLAIRDHLHAPSHTGRILHTTAFVIPAVEHWLEQYRYMTKIVVHNNRSQISISSTQTSCAKIQ